MREAARLRIMARIKARKPISHKKFCGHSRDIVDCPPRECRQIEGICPKDLDLVLKIHRPILEALREQADKKSKRTGSPLGTIAIQDYGHLVGVLVCLLNANTENSGHA